MLVQKAEMNIYGMKSVLSNAILYEDIFHLNYILLTYLSFLYRILIYKLGLYIFLFWNLSVKEFS